jgi:hypothetical protein
LFSHALKLKVKLDRYHNLFSSNSIHVVYGGKHKPPDSQIQIDMLAGRGLGVFRTVQPQPEQCQLEFNCMSLGLYLTETPLKYEDGNTKKPAEMAGHGTMPRTRTKMENPMAVESVSACNDLLFFSFGTYQHFLSPRTGTLFVLSLSLQSFLTQQPPLIPSLRFNPASGS